MKIPDWAESTPKLITFLKGLTTKELISFYSILYYKIDDDKRQLWKHINDVLLERVSNNCNCIRRIKHAIKNGQRPGCSIEKEMAKFGFMCYFHSYANEFITYLLKLSPKRRRAVFRVGRAALRKNTLVNVDAFDGNNDFHKIIFEDEKLRGNVRSSLHKWMKLYCKHLTLEEVIEAWKNQQSNILGEYEKDWILIKSLDEK